MRATCKYCKPQLIADELSIDRISELEKHYEKMEKGIRLQRCIFNIVFSGNKYLFALVASVLTGLSVNILTGFLNFNDYNLEKQLHIAVLLVFVVAFTASLILFTAKIAQIQESGSTFVPNENQRLSYRKVLSAQKNVVYSNCLGSIRYLVWLYCLSIFFGICTVIVLFFGVQVIAGFQEVIACVRCLFQN